MPFYPSREINFVDETVRTLAGKVEMGLKALITKEEVKELIRS